MVNHYCYGQSRQARYPDVAYKVYLDSNFEPTTREKATLIKAVSDDGRVRFYYAKQTARTMKAMSDIARADEWLSIGAELGIDFETIARAAWIEGCEHEMEHAATVDGDKLTIAKIALDHLREDAEYYRKLRNIESAGKLTA